jgi:hypothetical protein
MGLEGLGIEAQRLAISSPSGRRMGQGDEPAASRNGTRSGVLLMTVLIYVDTSKQVGDKDHLKVFANGDAMEKWFAEHDPEGVAFEYEVL